MARKAAKAFGSDDGISYRTLAAVDHALPPAFYIIEYDHLGPKYSRMNLSPIVVRPDKYQSQVLDEADSFWSAEKDYANMGIPHKRGLLLYGPPGTGKSTVIRVIGQDIIKRNGVVFMFKSCDDSLSDAIGSYRMACPRTPMAVVIEDVDQYIEHSEEELLDILDGTATEEHILFIATTNYREKLSDRLIRSSRFDTHIEIGYPDEDSRRNYVASLINDPSKTSLIESITKETELKSMAEVKELVLQRLIFHKYKKKVAQG